MRTYETLASKVSNHIEAYMNDLTKHDRAWIEANPGVPFLHFTRSCGTHLLPLPDATSYPAKGQRVPYLFASADRDHMLSEVVSFCRHCTDCETTRAIYHFDGRKLIHTSPDAAKETARQYQRRIWAQWNRQEIMSRTEYVAQCHLG